MEIFRIEERPGRGRCCIANRKISIGEIILDEEPYAHVIAGKFAEVTCARCMKLCSNEKVFALSVDDKLRYCSENCITDDYPVHSLELNAQKEICSFGIKEDQGLDSMMLVIRIAALRKLESSSKLLPSSEIRSGRSNQFSDILLLNAHRPSSSKQQEVSRISTVLSRILKNNSIPLNNKEIEKLLYAIQCNAHRIVQPSHNTPPSLYSPPSVNTHPPSDPPPSSPHLLPLTPSVDRPLALGLFPFTSMLNHSCLPNCHHDFRFSLSPPSTSTSTSSLNLQNSLPLPKLVMRATREILEGEELCYSYIPLYQSTPSRQSQLLSAYSFLCNCPRCQHNSNPSSNSSSSSSSTTPTTTSTNSSSSSSSTTPTTTSTNSSSSSSMIDSLKKKNEDTIEKEEKEEEEKEEEEIKKKRMILISFDQLLTSSSSSSPSTSSSSSPSSSIVLSPTLFDPISYPSSPSSSPIFTSSDLSQLFLLPTARKILSLFSTLSSLLSSSSPSSPTLSPMHLTCLSLYQEISLTSLSLLDHLLPLLPHLLSSSSLDSFSNSSSLLTTLLNSFTNSSPPPPSTSTSSSFSFSSSSQFFHSYLSPLLSFHSYLSTLQTLPSSSTPSNSSSSSSSTDLHSHLDFLSPFLSLLRLGLVGTALSLGAIRLALLPGVQSIQPTESTSTLPLPSLSLNRSHSPSPLLHSPLLHSPLLHSPFTCELNKAMGSQLVLLYLLSHLSPSLFSSSSSSSFSFSSSPSEVLIREIIQWIQSKCTALSQFTSSFPSSSLSSSSTSSSSLCSFDWLDSSLLERMIREGLKVTIRTEEKEEKEKEETKEEETKERNEREEEEVEVVEVLDEKISNLILNDTPSDDSSHTPTTPTTTTPTPSSPPTPTTQTTGTPSTMNGSIDHHFRSSMSRSSPFISLGYFGLMFFQLHQQTKQLFP